MEKIFLFVDMCLLTCHLQLAPEIFLFFFDRNVETCTNQPHSNNNGPMHYCFEYYFLGDNCWAFSKNNTDTRHSYMSFIYVIYVSPSDVKFFHWRWPRAEFFDFFVRVFKIQYLRNKLIQSFKVLCTWICWWETRCVSLISYPLERNVYCS